MAASTIRFLGTGTAFHTDGRGSQSIWIEPALGGPFLVDFGPTALAAMNRFEVDATDLDRLFVTHLHGDHTAGWPFLMLHLCFRLGRSRPLHVHGPEGVEECLLGLLRACYRDLADELSARFEIRYHELPVQAASGLSAGALAFDVLPMDHHASSLAFRFHTGEGRVAVSGDTRWCANLEELGRHTELLIVECTSVDHEAPGHISLKELREGVGRLGAGEIVLVHLPDEVASALAADPIPRVTASYDGMELSMRAAHRGQP